MAGNASRSTASIQIFREYVASERRAVLCIEYRRFLAKVADDKIMQSTCKLRGFWEAELEEQRRACFLRG